jgi:hypothetical protein
MPAGDRCIDYCYSAAGRMGAGVAAEWPLEGIGGTAHYASRATYAINVTV